MAKRPTAEEKAEGRATKKPRVMPIVVRALDIVGAANGVLPLEIFVRIARKFLDNRSIGALNQVSRAFAQLMPNGCTVGHGNYRHFVFSAIAKKGQVSITASRLRALWGLKSLVLKTHAATAVALQNAMPATATMKQLRVLEVHSLEPSWHNGSLPDMELLRVAFRELTALRTLSMFRCYVAARPLAELPSLTSLSLECCFVQHIDSSAMDAWCTIAPRLRQLHFEATTIAAGSIPLSRFTALTSLKWVDVNGPESVGDRASEELETLTQLRSLTLQLPNVPLQRGLCALGQLEELTLLHCMLSGVNFGGLQSLRALTIRDGSGLANDPSLPLLHLPQLTTLALAYHAMGETADALKHWVELHQMQLVSLESYWAPVVSWASALQFPLLRHLTMKHSASNYYSAEVAMDDLRTLATRLETLKLAGLPARHWRLISRLRAFNPALKITTDTL